MKRALSLWLIYALALWMLDRLFGSISFANTGALLMTALILAMLDETVKPLLQALSLPITFFTLGLFAFAVNGFVLYLAFRLTAGSYIRSLGTAIWAALVLSILNSLLRRFFGVEEE